MKNFKDYSQSKRDRLYKEYVDKFNKVIDDREHYQKLARDNGLKISTGSDFHKIDGIHPEIGFVNYEM